MSMTPEQIIAQLRSSILHAQRGPVWLKWADEFPDERIAVLDYLNGPLDAEAPEGIRTEHGLHLMQEVTAFNGMRLAYGYGGISYTPPAPQSISSTDAGSGSDDAFRGFFPASSDSGVGVDSISGIKHTASDTGTSTENANLGTGVATRPTAPTTYTPPAGTSVSSSSALVSALASGTPTTIIVEDGIYTHTSYATVGAAHQVYARNLGGAEIRFGLQGNVSGVRLQGLKFNVSDSTRTLNSIVVHMWGGSNGSWNILDCYFTGTDSISAAIAAKSNQALESLIIRRVEIRNFHDYGVLADANDTTFVPTTQPIIEDLYTENIVHKTDAQGSNGVSEAGLWLGCKATVNRCWFHQVKGYATGTTRGTLKAWQGLWIGTNVRNCTISDILVTGWIAFGIYGYGPLNSDDTSTVTINRLETHWPVNVGHHQEWNNPTAAHHPNTQNVVLQDSYLETQSVGVHYDTGTNHSTVKNTVFVGQESACINNYQEDVGEPNLYDVTGNDYSGKLAGAVNVSTAYVTSFPHWNVDGGPGE